MTKTHRRLIICSDCKQEKPHSAGGRCDTCRQRQVSREARERQIALAFILTPEQKASRLALVEAIKTGDPRIRLRHRRGRRLDSVYRLAADFGLDRLVVLAVLKALREQGYLEHVQDCWFLPRQPPPAQ